MLYSIIPNIVMMFTFIHLFWKGWQEAVCAVAPKLQSFQIQMKWSLICIMYFYGSVILVLFWTFLETYLKRTKCYLTLLLHWFPPKHPSTVADFVSWHCLAINWNWFTGSVPAKHPLSSWIPSSTVLSWNLFGTYRPVKESFTSLGISLHLNFKVC